MKFTRGSVFTRAAALFPRRRSSGSRRGASRSGRNATGTAAAPSAIPIAAALSAKTGRRSRSFRADRRASSSAASTGTGHHVRSAECSGSAGRSPSASATKVAAAVKVVASGVRRVVVAAVEAVRVRVSAAVPSETVVVVKVYNNKKSKLKSEFFILQKISFDLERPACDRKGLAAMRLGGSSVHHGHRVPPGGLPRPERPRGVQVRRLVW